LESVLAVVVVVVRKIVQSVVIHPVPASKNLVNRSQISNCLGRLRLRPRWLVVGWCVIVAEECIQKNVDC
jgi:hypothetical protein